MEAHRIIERAETSGRVRAMVSFGKDSLVLIDLLSQHGIRDVLYCDDLDEVHDQPFIDAIVQRYGLTVHRMARGRAMFFVVQGTPLFLSWAFVSDRHLTPIPTNLVAYEAGDRSDFLCIDEELRATRAPILDPIDQLFAGFKLSDVTTTTCRTFVNLLGEERLTDRVQQIRQQGPHLDLAPGLPVALPLFAWTDAQVWDYLYEHSVPWSSRVYDDEGHRRPTGRTACFRCHDPRASSIVGCPRMQMPIVNLAALTQDTDLQLERLRRLGVMTAAELEDLHG